MKKKKNNTPLGDFTTDDFIIILVSHKEMFQNRNVAIL